MTIFTPTRALLGGLLLAVQWPALASEPASHEVTVPTQDGETVVVPESRIRVEEEDSRMFLFDPGVTLSDLVRAVNEVGAAPGDLIAILEALKRVGALRAELVVI